MNRIAAFLVCWILLSSCSMTMEQVFLIPTQTSAPTATNTIVPTENPTITATIPTPTFTITPTLAGQRTDTPTPDFTPTLPSVPPLVLFTPNTATPKVGMKGFVTAFTSGKEFFKDGICEPTRVKFTAQAANPTGTAFVQLFVRFKSKQTGATSEWTSIKMNNMGAGTFVYDLTAVEMKGEDSFRNSWVQYQFVATDSRINEIGRTDIFGDTLSVLECVPTPVPLESPTPTATMP